MSFRLNKDKETVRNIQRSLKNNGGYCPCRTEQIPENKCICKEFKEQLKDPNFEGYCHCKLYYKPKA